MIVLSEATKGKIINTRTIALKLGQKDSVKVPAIEVEFNTSVDKLKAMLGPVADALFTDKPSTAPKDVKAHQQGLDGVNPVSDRTWLSDAGQKLGEFAWDHEQTGCKFVLVRGTGKGKSNIVLDGMTAKKWRFKAQEGGVVRVKVHLLSTRSEELDDATHGVVMKMQKGNIEFTLEPPAVDKAQADAFEDGDGEQLGDGKKGDATQQFIAAHGNKGDRPGTPAH